ncbi:MAG TPA: M23 family metallopeptidase [Acidimicrobiales bacterium]|nr:M23 family metallopeptidase [Acidimicrobiales bacterium]
MSRARTASLAAALATAAALVGALTAGAQVPPLPTPTTAPATTTTTTRPPDTTTTTTTIPLRPSESTTTTQPPPPEPEPEPRPGPGPAPGPQGDTPNPDSSSSPGDGESAGPVAPGGTDSGSGSSSASPELASGPFAAAGTPGAPAAGEPLAAGVIPEDAQRLMDSIRRTPANNTRRLMEALAPLRSFGLSDAELVDVGFGRFPVGGRTTFTDDWYFPRFVPTFHLHVGTDLFAACGTPARSPADGTLKLAQGGSGGLAAYVYQPDGTYYYLAHLQRFVPSQQSGQQVKLGETIGYVGDTGNAVGGPCHVHFEIHPAPAREVVTGKGKERRVTLVPRPVPIGSKLEPVNPKPYLDAWLEEARLQVPQLIAAMEGRPRALLATGLTRRMADGRAGSFPAPAVPPRSQLLWATSASPAGGAWRLAQAEALSVATDVDWTSLARRQQSRLLEEQRARELTQALLTPLTPPSMRSDKHSGPD